MVWQAKRRAVEPASREPCPGRFPYTTSGAKLGPAADLCRGSFTERQSNGGFEIRDGSRSDTARVVRRTFRSPCSECYANSRSRSFRHGGSAHRRTEGTAEHIRRPAGPHRGPHTTARRAGDHNCENRSGAIFLTIIRVPIQRAKPSKRCFTLCRRHAPRLYSQTRREYLLETAKNTLLILSALFPIVN